MKMKLKKSKNIKNVILILMTIQDKTPTTNLVYKATKIIPATWEKEGTRREHLQLEAD